MGFVFGIDYLGGGIFFNGVDFVYNISNRYAQEIIIQILLPLGLTVITIIGTLYIRSTTLSQIGKNTLLLCGMESMVKSLVPLFFTMCGLEFIPPNSLCCFLFVGICFGALNKWVFPRINRHMPWLAGKV